MTRLSSLTNNCLVTPPPLYQSQGGIFKIPLTMIFITNIRTNFTFSKCTIRLKNCFRKYKSDDTVEYLGHGKTYLSHADLPSVTRFGKIGPIGLRFLKLLAKNYRVNLMPDTLQLFEPHLSDFFAIGLAIIIVHIEKNSNTPVQL